MSETQKNSDDPVIFISYSNRGPEGKLVARLSELLKNALQLDKKGQVFAYDLAGQGAAPGSDLSDIPRMVRGCRVLLVVASPATMQSTWVGAELGAALASGKEIVPLLADSWCGRFIPSQIPGRTGTILNTVSSICAWIERLSESLGRPLAWSTAFIESAEEVCEAAGSMAAELRRPAIRPAAIRAAAGAVATVSLVAWAAALWRDNSNLQRLRSQLDGDLKACQSQSDQLTRDALNRLRLTVEGAVLVPRGATPGGIQVRACSSNRVKDQRCPEDSVVAETDTFGKFALDFSEPLNAPEIRVVATRDDGLGSDSVKPALTLSRKLFLGKR